MDHNKIEKSIEINENIEHEWVDMSKFKETQIKKEAINSNHDNNSPQKALAKVKYETIKQQVKENRETQQAHLLAKQISSGKETSKIQQNTPPTTPSDEKLKTLQAIINSTPLHETNPEILEGINNCTIIDPSIVTLQVEPISNSGDEDNTSHQREKGILIFESEYLEGIDQLPFGIFNKNRTGVGATSLELRSERNSIIVCPTRALAYNKYRNHPDKYLYVGSPIGSLNTTTSNSSINEYMDMINNKEKMFKKFLVVADSLHLVINYLKNRGENLEDYFLMIDEIDSLQSDSSFRPVAEDVIDYYLEHPTQSRCLVSATLKGFSNPQLAGIDIIHAEFSSPKARNITSITSSCPDITAAKQILSTTRDSSQKVMIAYNSISCIKNIIELLKQEGGDEISSKIAVLCGMYGRKEVGEYYIELKGNRLPKQITFITSAYFVGVDIDEDFHLISVANTQKTQSLLSIEKIIQIAGRCRKQLLSDTIIHNYLPVKKRVDVQKYRLELLEEARHLQHIITHLKKIEGDQPRFQHLFQKVIDAIKKVDIKGVEGLVRQDIHGNYQISHLLIDSLCEKMELINDLYSCEGRLEYLLEKHEVGEISMKTDKSTAKEISSLNEIKKEEKIQRKENRSNFLIEAREKLKEIEGNWDELERMINTTTYDTQIFLKRIKLLGCYINWTLLASKLLTQKEGKLQNIRKDEFRWLYLGIKYWALDDNHKFKQFMNTCFKIGEKYTGEIIEKELKEIFRLLAIPVEFKNNQALKLFNKLMYTKRDKKAKGANRPYIIKGEYISHLFPEITKKLPLKDSDFGKYFLENLP